MGQDASIVIGGGLSASHVGQLALARAELLPRAERIDIDLGMITHKPDEAGLIGASSGAGMDAQGT